jgi:endonuclease/exonuclease/phosphatase family metal-dependent hydrolase
LRGYGLDDGENNWPHRKELCIEVIRSRAPQIICFQEVWAQQLVDLCAEFVEFDHVGMAYKPLSKDPVNTIFYHRESFGEAFAGGYWLSETPHVPGSSSWESAHVRLANWVRLGITGAQKELRVISTHLDSVSQCARENQARIINEDTVAYPDDYPQILAGDLNCDAGNATIRILKEAKWRDTYEFVHGVSDPGHTHHAFIGPAHKSDNGKIDWIFTRGGIKIVDAEVIKDAQDGRFPSDHYFLSCDIEV